MSNSREQSNKMVFLFKCALAALYVVMGVVCFFIKDRPVFAEYPQAVKWAFVILCILYGSFRLYRAINTEDE